MKSFVAAGAIFLTSDDITFAARLWWRLALGLWAAGGSLAMGVAVTWWMGP